MHTPINTGRRWSGGSPEEMVMYQTPVVERNGGGGRYQYREEGRRSGSDRSVESVSTSKKDGRNSFGRRGSGSGGRRRRPSFEKNRGGQGGGKAKHHTTPKLCKTYVLHGECSHGPTCRYSHETQSVGRRLWSYILGSWPSSTAEAENIMKHVVDPDTFHFNILMRYYSNAQNYAGAELVLRRLYNHRLQPSLMTWTTLLKSYSSNCRGAHDVMQRMRESGVTPDIVAWNMLLKSYVKCRDSRGAEQVVKMMQEQRVNPDGTTWSTLMESYIRDPTSISGLESHGRRRSGSDGMKSQMRFEKGNLMFGNDGAFDSRIGSSYRQPSQRVYQRPSSVRVTRSTEPSQPPPSEYR